MCWSWLFISFMLLGRLAIAQTMVLEEHVKNGIDSPVSKSEIGARSYQNRTQTVSEVLEEQAGVHLTRYGGMESQTSISIRGSQSDEVGIFLDGIPLQSADGRTPDLSLYDLDQLSSIDVYRGATPMGLGMSPSAGAVFLNTKEIENEGSASVSYGSFNTVKAHVTQSKNFERWGFLTGLSYKRTSGNFSFLDDNGTPVNSVDDARVRRQNNEAQDWHPNFKIFYKLDPKTKIEFLTHYIRRDAGVPGFSSNQSTEANLDTNEWMGALKVERGSFENLSYVRVLQTQFADPLGEIGLGGAQDNDNQSLFFGNKTNYKWNWGKHQQLQASVYYQGERFLPKNYEVTPSVGSKSRRHTLNFGLGDRILLWEERLRLDPEIRLENVWNHLSNQDPSFVIPGLVLNSRTQHFVTGQLGSSFRLTPWFLIKAQGGRYVRFPTFAELFGDRGGVVGNSSLDPQKSWQWDAGVRFESRTRALELTYYDKWQSDLIQFEPNAGFVRAENTGRAHLHGLEAFGNIELAKHLKLSGNYIFQRAIDRNTGRTLVGRPRHEANGKVEVFNKQARLFTGVNWMDRNYLDSLNTRSVRHRFFLNSGASVDFLKHWTASVEAKNLTNETTVDVVGYPLPGRSFFGKLELKW